VPDSVRRSVPERHHQANMFNKTSLCRYFASGTCGHGPSCAFAHGESELRPKPDFQKTKRCVAFATSGFCAMGAACSFAHARRELRRRGARSRPSAPDRAGATGASAQHSTERRTGLQRNHHQKRPCLESNLASLVVELQRLSAAVEALSSRRSQEQSSQPCAANGDMPTESGTDGREDTPYDDAGHSKPTGSGMETASNVCRDKGSVPLPQDEFETGRHGRHGACCPIDAKKRQDASQEMEDQDSITYELVIERTFLSLTPVSTLLTRRRWRSAPPRCSRAAVSD